MVLEVGGLVVVELGGWPAAVRACVSAAANTSLANSPVAEPAPVPRTVTRPWYRDKLGLALTGGGLVTGIAGILVWTSARSDRDAADGAATYDEFSSLVDRAHGKQTTALVLGAAGVALVSAGAVHLYLHRKDEVLVVAPTAGGPVVVGGVRVTPGQLVLADDDGIVIAPREQLEACVPRAQEIEAVEAEVLAATRRGGSLIDMTNLREHVARLRAGEASSLAITPPA